MEILRIKIEYHNRSISKIAVLVDLSKKSEEKLTHLRSFTADYKQCIPRHLKIQANTELSDMLISDVIDFGLKSEDITQEFPEFQKPNF